MDMDNEQKPELQHDIKEDNEELDMVQYRKKKVSFYVTTKRGKKKKITFTAREPIEDEPKKKKGRRHA